MASWKESESASKSVDDEMTIQEDYSVLTRISNSNEGSGIKVTGNHCSVPAPMFLNTKSIIKTLLSVDNFSKLLPCVPNGLKENVSFIVDNRINSRRQELGLKGTYEDDSGPWNCSDSHSVTRYFLYDSLKSIELKDGIYCKETRRDKKRVYLPLDPQPTPESILSVQSYYVKHAFSKSYRKKVTWLGSLPKFVPPVILYEYSGQAPKELKESLPPCSTEVYEKIYCCSSEEDVGDARVDCLSLVIHEYPHLLEAVGGHKLPDVPEKQLDMDVMLKSVKNIMKTKNMLKEVPEGLKENMFFIVDAEMFLHNQSIGTCNIWSDDSGPWDYEKSSCENCLFLCDLNESFRGVDIKEGLYCTAQSKDAQLPLIPQPNLENILSVQKYDICHKYSERYKRRITIFKSMEEGGPSTAFVEYHGAAPEKLKHELNNKSYASSVRDKSCAVYTLETPTSVKAQCTLSAVVVPSEGCLENEWIETETNSRFLPLHLILTKLKDSSAMINSYPQVPAGLKENKQFIVKNSLNVQRHRKGRKCTFWDDSGPWVSQVTTKSLYVTEDGTTMKKIVEHNEMYCSEHKVDGKKIYIPLVPQPHPNNIIVWHRNSSRHKNSNSYKRRITWLEDGSDDLPCLAFYEYYGTAPDTLRFYFADKVNGSLQNNYMREKIMDAHCWIKSVNGGYMLTHPGGKFLDLYEVISALQMIGMEDEPLHAVPCGLKENQFFIVCNKENLERQKLEKKNVFWDDCGAWNTNCTKTSTERYLCGPNQKLTRILDVQGEMCIERTREGNRMYIPLCPQPRRSTMIVIHRNISKHSLSKTYQRKVTWLENCEKDFPEVACYEYLGKFLGYHPHRSCKKNIKNYIRTKRSFTGEERDSDLCLTSGGLYEETDEDVASANHDTGSFKKFKQVQNVKKYQSEDSRNGIRNGVKECKEILDMVHSHPFVQVVTSSKGKRMSVVMYVDDQLLDLKRFCCYSGMNETTILSFSNIHDCCGLTLTYSVFKNLSVFRKNSKQNPLFPGPLFLHEKSDFTSYTTLFVQLASQLGKDTSQLIIISEGKEMQNAFLQAFPNGISLSSIQYLQKEFCQFLKEQKIMQPEKRNLIRAAVFGEEGIISAKDTNVFSDRMERTQNICDEISTNVGIYYKEHIVPYLKNNFKIMQKFNIPLATVKWSGLSCNTFKNTFKIHTICTEEKHVKLIIQELYEIVSVLYGDLDRSLYGHGEFSLCQDYRKFFRTADVWYQMDEDTRVKHFQDFMGTPKQKRGKSIVKNMLIECMDEY
ncbi:uncharacterized protein [Palaemon carinicauda]|uniref:uncharacterized protein n=1 Tax=Palaemon carinicauda TaxID=392227 RepID=UPI0035B596B9